MEKSEEIASFLDAENSISTRWVANTLRVDMVQARRLMVNFKENDDSISASYLVIGQTSEGGLSVSVVTDNELDKARRALASVRSEEIYALHKVPSESNKVELQASEFQQASEILDMAHPNTDYFLENRVGLITCPSVDIKPIGQRILSSKHVAKTSTMTAATSLKAKNAIKSSVTGAVNNPPPVPSAVLQSKSSIKAANFFSKNESSGGTSSKKSQKGDTTTNDTAQAKVEIASAPMTVAESTRVEQKEEVLSLGGNHSTGTTVPRGDSGATTENTGNGSSSSGKKRVGKVQLDDDEDEEWDSSYKPDPARLQERIKAEAETVAAARRARIVIGKEDMDNVDNADGGEGHPDAATAGEEAGREAEVEVDSEEEGGEAGDAKKGKKSTKTKTKKAAVQNAHVHGAMDSFMEDVAIAEYKKVQEAEATGNTALLKRKKRTLVEKMFADEKGYLVSEMVWEEVTDDELEAPVSSRSPQAKKAKTLSAAAADSSSSAGGAGGGGDKENDNNKKKKPANKAGSSSASAATTASAPKSSGTQQRSMMSFFAKK